jgi:hypothetical protein
MKRSHVCITAILLLASTGGVLVSTPARALRTIEAGARRARSSSQGPGKDVERGHARELAITAMRATQESPKDDFLEEHGIATPMPVVAGAIPEHARVKFPSALLGLPADLLVIFTIADFEGSRDCSNYYVPDGAWYNVFYGTYGILSHKPDGTWWGYDADGKPDFDEMLRVPQLDYNVLTAGQLGCPPEKRSFKILDLKTSKVGDWDRGDAVAQIPSGLHRWKDSLRADPLYYTIFGYPDQMLIGNRESYEPVTMRGQLFFRRLTEVQGGDRITMVFGAMCPDTPEGNALLKKIIDTLAPLYHAAGEPH